MLAHDEDSRFNWRWLWAITLGLAGRHPRRNLPFGGM